MRSANPALNAFSKPQTWDDAHGAVSRARPGAMTVGGTITAAAILLGICSAAAIGSWAAVSSPTYQGLALPFLIGGVLGGLILGLVISFSPRTAPFLAPLYAACEGLLLGALSYVVGQSISARVGQDVGASLVLQAISLTLAVAGAMLLGYRTGIIRPGRVFRACVISAGGGLLLFSLVAVVLSLFGNRSLIALYSFSNGSAISIGFSVLSIVIASLFLVLDFEFIEQGARAGLPKHMEWYGGFALLVTLVWLYVELLRLLSKLRSK